MKPPITQCSLSWFFITQYQLSGKINEIFVCFIQPKDQSAECVSVLAKLGVSETPRKLIAQSYDSQSCGKIQGHG